MGIVENFKTGLDYLKIKSNEGKLGEALKDNATEIKENFKTGYNYLKIKSNLINDPVGPILDSHKELIKRVEKHSKEYEELSVYQKTPFTDLPEEIRNKMVDYNKPENIITRQEYLDYKNIINETKSALKEKDDLLKNESFGDRYLRNVAGFVDKVSNIKTISEVKENYNTTSEVKEKYDKQIAEVKKNVNFDLLDKNIEFAKIHYAEFKELMNDSAGVKYAKNAGKQFIANGERIYNGFKNGDPLEVVNGSLSNLFIPVVAAFDKEVTGSLGEAGSAGFNVPLDLIGQTVSKASSAAGANYKTSEQLGELAILTLPFVKGKGKNPGKVLNNEALLLAKLDKKYHPLYVNGKKTFYKIDKLEFDLQNIEAIKKGDFETILTKDNKGGYNTEYKIINEGISNTQKLGVDFIKAMDKGNFKLAKEIEGQITVKYNILKEQKNNIFKENIKKYIDNVAEKIGFKQNFIEGDKIALGEVVKGIPLDFTKISDLGSFLNKDLRYNVQDSIVGLRGNREYKDNELDKIIRESINSKISESGLSQKEFEILVDNTKQFYKKDTQDIKNSLGAIKEIQDNKGANSKEAIQELKDMGIEVKKGDFGELDRLPEKIEHIAKLVTKGILENNGLDPKNNNLISYKIAPGAEGFFNDKAIFYNNTNGGLYHIPKAELSMANIGKNIKEYELARTELKTQIDDFDKLIKENTKGKYVSKIIKAYSNSRVTKTDFIKQEIKKVKNKFNTRQGQEIISELENAQAGSRFNVDGETIGVKSTFPKWVKGANIRSSEVFARTLKNIEVGNFTEIKRKPDQILMEQILEKLGSPLSEFYIDEDFAKIKEVGDTRIKKINYKKFKDYKRAYEIEAKNYIRLEKSIEILENSLEKGHSKEIRKLLKQYYEKTFALKDSINREKTRVAKRDEVIKEQKVKLWELKERKKFLNLLKREYPSITNYRAKQLLDSIKSKRWDLQTEGEFIKFIEEYDNLLISEVELQIKVTRIKQLISEKNIKHIENLFEIEKLPKKIEDFTVEDIQRLEIIIEGLEYGDKILTKRNVEVLDKNGSGIRTYREATEGVFKKAPKLKEILYRQKNDTIKKLEDELVNVEEKITKYQDNKKNNIENNEKNIEELGIQAKQIKDKIESEKNKKVEIDFNKENTSVNEQLKNQAVLEGSNWEKFKHDSAFAKQDPLNEMIVKDLYEAKAKYDGLLDPMLDKYGVALDKARSARLKLSKQKIKDYLIPTDDVLIKYIENPELRSEMEKSGKVLLEEVEAANIMIGIFEELGNMLVERGELEKIDGYVTHTGISVAEVFKNEGIKQAWKSIWKNKVGELDFGAIEANQLGLTKFFKYAEERKGGLQTSKNSGKLLYSYVHAIKKKLILDDVMPQSMLYVKALGDSKKQEIYKDLFNSKKGKESGIIEQGSVLYKILTINKGLISLVDLGFNIVTAAASILGVVNANSGLLGFREMGKGAYKKYTPKGKEIIEKYKDKIGRNPVTNMASEISKRADLTPLEKGLEGAWVMLASVFQAGVNTAFIAKLTPEEFKSGEISDKRIGEIMIEIGEWHTLPGTSSIYGNNILSKNAMMYKNWANQYLQILGNVIRVRRGGNRFTKEEHKKANKDFIGLIKMPLIILSVYYLTTAEDDRKRNKANYVVKRLLGESLGAFSASDYSNWNSIRTIGALESVGKLLKQVLTLEKYKTSGVDSSGMTYKKGDLKAINKLEKILLPGSITSIGKVKKSFTSKKKKKKSSKKYDF